MTKIEWDYNKVKEFVSSKGVELVSTQYKNKSEKLIFKCPKCEDIYELSFANFLRRKNI